MIKQSLNKIQAIASNKPVVYEFAKFSIVGVSGAIVDFTTYTLLTRAAGMYYLYATAISVFLAIFSNFIFNKLWTFRRWNSGQARSEYVKFVTVSAINYLINLGITYSIIEFTRLETLFGLYEDFFAKISAILIVLFSNYFGNKYWTFKR